MKIETKTCRHGKFSYFVDDEFVGHSLRFYGEYSPDEVVLFQKVLKPDDVAVEIGSNIGALTIPMAQLCRQVYAFEPHPDNYALLQQNLQNNGLSNVTAINTALGSRNGFTRMFSLERLGHFNFGRLEIGDGNLQIEMTKLDDILGDEPIRLIKIDVEGAELDVLKGAEKIIQRYRPLLYVENDRVEKSAELVGWLIDHDYKCHWHKAPLYYDGNFRDEKLNIFPNVVAENMICFPEEMQVAISKLPEVPDKRADDLLYVRAKTRMLRRLSRVEDDSLDAMNIRATLAHYSNLMNDEAEADAYLKQNLALNPDHLGSLAMFGLFELQRGNYKDGWKSYELRYHQDNPSSFGWRPHDAPHWDGRPTDKVVLVWSEQGWGDSIMFCRFMAEVLKRAPNAILDIQPQFFELFESSNIMPLGQMFRRYRKQPKYDYHCSMPSLPAVLGLESENDLRRGKYLFPDAGLIESWKEHKNPGIGICHHGAAYSERPYSRDMPWQLANDLAQRFGPFMTLTHEGQWESFADTAAAIETLDLVITVDTAIAHLAGALGVPTWLMLSTDPDWRWQKRRSDSPWYPSMRIFRQKKFMDWSNVVDEIAAELERKAAKAA